MSDLCPPEDLPMSELSEKPLPEYTDESLPECTDEPPTDNTPQETSQESRFAIGTGEFTVESRVRKIVKTMCVTTNGRLMVVVWANAAMFFSGLSLYWFLATLPFLRRLDNLIFYPASAALVVVLLLSPVFAFAGDVLFGNFRLLLMGVIPLNLFGLVIVTILWIYFNVTYYFLVVGYFLMLLAGGIFQANAIQLGRDVLGDFNSPERSTFIHWYYWATYVPILAFAATFNSIYWTFFAEELSYLVIFVPIAMFGILNNIFLIFFLVTCIVHCVHLRNPGRNTVLPRITGNPVTQIFRVTRYALQSSTSPGHRGCLIRLNNARQSNGGLANDEDVDNVRNFWLLVLLMVSLYGFFFWDDMWALPLAYSIIDGNNAILWILSSQAATSVIVFIGVPIYQLVVRPLMGNCSPLLLQRIFAGLILQLISLVIVTWNAGARPLSSEMLSDACNVTTSNTLTIDHDDAGEGVSWLIWAIPQGVNGVSQLLVFPAVIELILTDATRAMQGLLIGLWYAMQSIHILVAIVETATCAVFYWQYYIMKIVLVFVSSIVFGLMAFFYRHNRVVHNSQHEECVTHRQPQEISCVDNL